MKKKPLSSLHEVGHRTEKISIRVTPETNKMKPPSLSWGDFLERLVQGTKDAGIYQDELVRYCAWCAVMLDQIGFEVREHFPSDPAMSSEQANNRLVRMAELTLEMAKMRNRLEQILDDCK
jgi:hypothetical protein